MSKIPSKTNPAQLSIDDFAYELPDERIARYPLAQRDASKLLVHQNGAIKDLKFDDLPQLLHSGDCLVFNDTKVVHARMFFQRETGAQIEVFCLEPVSPSEAAQAFSTKQSTTWKAMIGNAKRWKAGEVLTKKMQRPQGSYDLNVELLQKDRGTNLVHFTWEEDLTFAEVLDAAGTLPIPPYLNRDTEAEDEERYQTVYALADGSVAAPTAGLHFTQRTFDALKNKQVKSLFVTLHVGAGTFKPVKSDSMEGHEMHQEYILVGRNMVTSMREAYDHQRIIPVGTTSLRTIESIYWFGVKILTNEHVDHFFVGQWEPYELEASNVSVVDALDAVMDWMDARNLSYLSGNTQILIAPGYTIRMAHALITNFHQPRSTLLLLVAALMGAHWREVYEHALKNDYRFLSFGDSSILFRE